MQLRNLILPFALFSIAFFWGTTYLAIRIAVETIPPSFVVGLRHFTAGLLISIALLIKKQLFWPGWQRIKRNCILSFLMLMMANGLTTYAEQVIPSGLAALLTTLSPILVLIFSLSSGKEKLSLKVASGIFLGFAGMILIFYDSLTQLFNPAYRFGILAILAGIFCWSIGTVYSKSTNKNTRENIFLDLAIQMLFGGAILLLVFLFTSGGEDYSTWHIKGIVAIFYLVIFGSIIGYISYNYALTKMPSTAVSVFTYCNVVVALFLGWLILDEQVSIRIIFATILILSGVILANFKKKKTIAPVPEPVN